MSDIYTKIPLVMAEIGAIGKDRQNEQQKYQFRGIEDFYNAAHPALHKHGVFCAPEVIEHVAEKFEKDGYEGKKTVWRHVTVKVRHRFYTGDGSYVDVVTMGEGLDNSDKATNKAMSGAMKYALIELFSVPTQDVEDAARTTPEIADAVPVKRTFTKPGTVIKAPPTLAEAVAATEAFLALAEESAAAKPAIEYATEEQRKYLIIHFRDALRTDLQPHADQLRRDFLKMEGYADEAGEGTTDLIPRKEFKRVCAKALKHAGEL